VAAWRLALLVATSSLESQALAQEPVDLALVIAVDVSRSMDDEEFRLQRNGYIEAIRHPDFIRAATSGGEGRIALAYVEWAGRLTQRVVVPWRIIDGPKAADDFSTALEAEPIDIGRGTSVSSAMAFASTLLHSQPFGGAREVIDISGDGPNNYGPPVAQARDRALSAGIVINGLPIVIRPSPIVPDIVSYYSDCVVGGPGSFVLPVRTVDGFSEAIRRKLILEVAGREPAQIVPATAAAGSADCLAGEKARARYADPYYPGLDN